MVVVAFAYVFLRSGWAEVDERHFDQQVLRASRPALVYFDTAIGCRGGDVTFRTLSRRSRGALDVFHLNPTAHRRPPDPPPPPPHLAPPPPPRPPHPNPATPPHPPP